MRSIGFRAEKSLVRYVVLDGDTTAAKIAFEGKIEIGDRHNICQEFVLLRTALQNLLETTKPDVGGIRLADSPQHLSNMQSWFSRARAEGVIMLAAGEHGLSIKAGAAGTMKAGIGTKRSLREYSKEDEVRGVDLTVKGRKSPEYHDAFYAALAALGG